MTSDLELRFDRLEKRVAWFQYRQALIVGCLQDDYSRPWLVFILENDLTDEQKKGIEDAMNDTHEKLVHDAPIDVMDFEKRLFPYIPEKEKPCGIGYDFIQRLLIMCTRMGLWCDVCDRFRDDFNVPTFDKLRHLELNGCR